jgi:amidohydrolase
LMPLASLTRASVVHAAPAPAPADEALHDQVIAWRRDLHQHPELGNRETRTAGVVAKQLRKLGLEVEEKVAVTGVVALLRGGHPGPTLALRADMDALPVTERGDLSFRSTATATFNGQSVGVMHACGHDGHMAMLLGVATTLAARREQLHGNVLFVFQPSEEGPPAGEEGGAALMLKEGVFTKHKPAAVVGLHLLSNWHTGEIAVKAGPIMAESDSFRIIVSGRQTHGSKPWSGVDPIVTAAQMINALQTIVSRRVDLTRSPAVVSVGMIAGGVRYNIIPDRVEMLGTIRSFEDDTRERIYADVRRIAATTAEMNGATAEVKIERHTTVLNNDAALTARLRPALVAVVGAEHVLDAPPQTVAEDFALFAEAVPGLYFFVGSTAPTIDTRTAPANHSPDFALDEDALAIGMRALIAVTDLYLTPAR